MDGSFTRAGCVGGLVVWLVVSGGSAGEGFQGAPPGATSKPDYQGTAVIVGLHPPPSSLHATRPVAVLDHDPIVGLMDEKMTMPFLAASTDLFRDLKPGDHVAFGLKSTEDALLVISLQRLTTVRRR